MQTYNCEKCGLFINETEKLWNEFQTSKECPRCNAISAGLMTSGMGKPISKSEIKKNRTVVGLFLICLGILSLLYPISKFSGAKLGVINAIISITGPIGFSSVLIMTGVLVVFFAVKIK